MKRILLPTDFSPVTIRQIEKLKSYYPDRFEIVLTHLFYLPDNIQDLLFSTYRVKEYEFVSNDFKLSFSQCMEQDSCDNTKKLPVRFFYGNTLIFFKNFLLANHIDLIAYSEQEPVKKLNSSSMIPVLPIIKKCGIQLLNTDTLSINQN